MADDDVVELRTARTTIRPWRMGEADFLFDIRRRPEIATWLGDPTPWDTVDTARDYIAECAATATPALPRTLAIVPHRARSEAASWHATGGGHPRAGDGGGHPQAGDDGGGDGDDSPPIGSVSLFPLPGPDGVSIGWYLHPDVAGNGWASEAAKAMLDHALGVGHDVVWAIMWAHNAPSASVCRRIGMTDLGVHVDPWYGTRQYPLSRFFCAGPGTAGAGGLLREWGAVAELPDDPEVVPPPVPPTT